MTDDESRDVLLTAIGNLWSLRAPEIVSDLSDLGRLLTEIPPGASGDSSLRLDARRDAHRLVGVLGVFGHHEAARAIAGVERSLANVEPFDSAELANVVRGVLASVDAAARNPQNRR